MARKAFYSFHYKKDGWRVSQVRNIGKLEADGPLSDNDWEQLKRKGDAAVKNWIDSQMFGKSCCVVLVGEQTASRRWVKYEISESWKSKKGIVGIRIHNLLDGEGNKSSAGPNPFDNFKVDGQPLSSIVKLYNPSGADSKSVYATISNNIAEWAEEAVAIRKNY